MGGVRYWAAVVVAADRPLGAVADELNAFLVPLKLIETDRFDEVSGFVAEANGLEFSLQGAPDGVACNSHYYFDFVCHEVGMASLPRSMSDLIEMAQPEDGSGTRRRASRFLQEKLAASTTLVCDAD